MILIKGRGDIPSPEEKVSLALGSNGEPELYSQEKNLRVEGGLETFLGPEPIESDPLWVAGVNLARELVGFSIHSRCFGNGGWYDPLFGAGYRNVFNVLTSGVLWDKDATPEEIADFLGKESREEAVSRVRNLLGRFEAVEVSTGPCSALLNNEELEEYNSPCPGAKAGSGWPQNRVLERARAELPKGSWAFYSSLTGWVEE